MSYPVLAPNNTWYKSSTTRSTITEINIVNSYAITGNENESWNADADNSGSIKCYRTGTILTIAGNGSGKIYANADSSHIFNGFSKMTSFINSDILDISRVTTLEKAFYDCMLLKNLELNSWNTSNVQNLTGTFNGMLALESISVSNWNTNSVTSMIGTFQCDSSLTELDLSNWTTDNVTSMKYMFSGLKNYGGAMSLTKIIGLENWNLSSCTDISYMFENCTSLTELDVSKWDVSNVKIFCGTFGANVTNDNMIITKLDVSSWNTSSATDMSYMFSKCMLLKELNLLNWDTSLCENMSYMFFSMYGLQKITFGKNFSFIGNGSTSCVLPTTNSSYIIGADGNWYTSSRIAYTPENIPNKTVMTYYASLDLVNNIDFLVKNGSLLDIADKIRFLSGITGTMSLNTMKTNLETERNNIENAFVAIGNKGGIVPESKTSQNLTTSIASIPEGVLMEDVFSMFPVVEEVKF